MAVTMTVTPEPANEPPRVKIELATNDPARAFSDITIRRDGQVIRAVAPTGSDVSVVYDYDCPFGVPVTYEAEGSDGGFTSQLDVTWANLSGWTTYSGTPAVAGGKLTAGGVSRSLAGCDRLVLHDADEFQGAIYLGVGVGGARLEIRYAGPNKITVTDFISGATIVTAPGTGDWTLTNGQVVSTAGTWNFPSPGDGLPVGNDTILVLAACTAFTTYTGTSPADFSLSDDTQLDAADAWLIHPVNPNLSVQLSNVADGGRRDRLYVDPAAARRVTYPAQREVFEPLGRTRKVPVTYGRRRAGEWDLVICAPRSQDRQAMRDILDDQAPLLLRIPPASPWDLDDGWYSVDDVDDERILDTPTSNPRTFTLPLTPVDEPALAQGAQWTYGDGLIHNPTYAGSLAEFPTYLDRLVGPS